MVGQTAILCMPVVRRPSMSPRVSRLAATVESTSLALNDLGTKCFAYNVLVVLNGPNRADDGHAYVNDVVRRLALAPHVNSVELVETTLTGKIAAVNFAISRLRREQGIVVVDDDIVIPPNAFREITAYLSAKRQHIQALCFSKAPAHHCYPRNSLQAQVSFLFHPSVQRLLVSIGFFSFARPTGSLYAIHRDHLAQFPNPCNEADILAGRRVQISAQYVRTWYDSTIAQEIARRREHIRAARGTTSIGVQKPLESLDTYHRVLRFPSHLPPGTAERVRRALETMHRIVRLAVEEP